MIARGYIMIAKAGQEGELGAVLAELSSALTGIEGFGGADILHDQGNPQRFIFIEKWADEAAHKAGGAQLPKEIMGRLMGTLDGKPDGSYYDIAG